MSDIVEDLRYAEHVIDERVMKVMDAGADEIESLRWQLASITEERDQWKNDAINGGNAAYLRQQLKDMTNHYNAALEAEQVRYRQVVEKDAEIERLKDYFTGLLEEQRLVLAASQSREQQLREICNELGPFGSAYMPHSKRIKLIDTLNSIPSDTTTLQSMITKAGEVMRERCAVIVDWFTPFVGGKIRALPVVTLDEIK